MADDFETTTATMEQYHTMVEDEVETNHGRLVNFVGDNFMAVFDEATAAMKTAITITTKIEQRNHDLPENSWVRFRMGLDTGDVTLAGDQWFGEPLNVASRVQTIAPAGGIGITGRVYQALDEPSLRFRSTGRKDLKGIPEQISVYEYEDLPTDRAGVSSDTDLSLGTPTVAVLPIHVGPDDGPLSEPARLFRGDLIYRLAQVPHLDVVDADVDRAAPARYMIELGIAPAGPDARIYARVIDVRRMTGVKAHRWTVALDELADRSDSMAEEVARSLEVELVVGAPAGLYAELNDPVAIGKIYLGWYHLTEANRESWTQARDLFGEVAEAHPEQPYGHVLSAFANWVGADTGWAADPKATLQLASDQAATSLALGDPTGMAKTVEAAVLLSQGRAEEALGAMDEVRIERPTCDVTFGLDGSVRRYLGQWDQSIESLDTAMRLTGMTKPWYPTVKACALYHGGHWDQAAATAEKVLEYQPNNLEALLVLAAAQKELGLDRRARATGDLVKERFPAVEVASWIDSHPYQVPAVVEHWKKDLAAVDLI